MAQDLVNEAEYIGTPCSPEFGTNPNSGKTEMKLSMEIVEGPLTGRKVEYKANLSSQKGILYAKKDLKAAGWKGVSVNTFVADINAAREAGLRVTFKARLAEATKPDGRKSQWWTVGSIGQSAMPLAAAPPSAAAEIDSLFGDAEGNGPDEDVPF